MGSFCVAAGRINLISDLHNFYSFLFSIVLSIPLDNTGQHFMDMLYNLHLLSPFGIGDWSLY